MNSIGRFLQVTSTGVYFFNNNISKYIFFLSFSFSLIPCQGKTPVAKYISIYPIDSKSSLRLCSTPLVELYEANLIVPNILPVI